MEDTRGDNESISGDVTVGDRNVHADTDKTLDNNDHKRNKEHDGNDQEQDKRTDEEHDETTDEIDKDNPDDDNKNEQVEKDEDEKDEAVHDKQPDEDNVKDELNDEVNDEVKNEADDADDNKEAEVNASEPSANEGNNGADEEETEVTNEETAADEEGRHETEEKEGEQEEAEEVSEHDEAAEDHILEKMEERPNEDTEQNGTHDLTEEEITRCQNMFHKKAINGRLDLKGFKFVFRVLGEIVASEEAEQMFDSGDRDGDNTIDLDEFLLLYSKYRQEEQARREAILESVDKLFLCGSGDSIELRKVQQLLLKLQQPDLDAKLVREKSDLGMDEVKRLVKSLDRNGSGCISKQDFVNILCEHLDI